MCNSWKTSRRFGLGLENYWRPSTLPMLPPGDLNYLQTKRKICKLFKLHERLQWNTNRKSVFHFHLTILFHTSNSFWNWEGLYAADILILDVIKETMWNTEIHAFQKLMSSLRKNWASWNKRVMTPTVFAVVRHTQAKFAVSDLTNTSSHNNILQLKTSSTNMDGFIHNKQSSPYTLQKL